MNDKPAPTVEINYRQIKQAERIEDILCLATLIAHGVLSPESDLSDSKHFYRQLKSCGDCPLVKTCLACIINE